MRPVADAARQRRRGFREGPRLVATTSVALCTLCALVLAREGAGEPGLRALVRATARFALVCFVAGSVRALASARNSSQVQSGVGSASPAAENRSLL